MDIDLDELRQLAEEAEEGKKKRGGAHEKQDMWTGEEMSRLLNLAPKYEGKNGKTAWKKLTQDHFQDRTERSVRSCYGRLNKATAKREAEDGEVKRNRCKRCGEIKLGHICDYVATALQKCQPVDSGHGKGSVSLIPVRSSFSFGSAIGSESAADGGGTGSKGGSSSSSGAAKGKWRAAGIKVVASNRIAASAFKDIKLHQVLDQLLDGAVIDPDLRDLMCSWAAQTFPDGVTTADPTGDRPRALTRADTDNIDASFEKYLQDLFH